MTPLPETERHRPDLQLMVLNVCGQCREGAGGECHEPGCAFWMNRAPDVPLTAMVSREEMIAAAASSIEEDTYPLLGSLPADAVATAALIAAGAILPEDPSS